MILDDQTSSFIDRLNLRITYEKFLPDGTEPSEPEP